MASGSLHRKGVAGCRIHARTSDVRNAGHVGRVGPAGGNASTRYRRTGGSPGRCRDPVEPEEVSERHQALQAENASGHQSATNRSRAVPSSVHQRRGPRWRHRLGGAWLPDLRALRRGLNHLDRRILDKGRQRQIGRIAELHRDGQRWLPRARSDTRYKGPRHTDLASERRVAHAAFSHPLVKCARCLHGYNVPYGHAADKGQLCPNCSPLAAPPV